MDSLNQFLPKFVPDNASRNTKYWVIINTLFPYLYTLIISTLTFLSSSAGFIIGVSKFLFFIYIMLIVFSIVAIYYLKANKQGFKEWWNSDNGYQPINPTDNYGSLSRNEDEPVLDEESLMQSI